MGAAREGSRENQMGAGSSIEKVPIRNSVSTHLGQREQQRRTRGRQFVRKKRYPVNSVAETEIRVADTTQGGNMGAARG